jgi:hypothetical protein
VNWVASDLGPLRVAGCGDTSLFDVKLSLGHVTIAGHEESISHRIEHLIRRPRIEVEENMRSGDRQQIHGIGKNRTPLFASMWMALFIALRHEFILARATR